MIAVMLATVLTALGPDPCEADGFAVGQRWSVPALGSDAQVVVGRIDGVAGETVVSVSVHRPAGGRVEAGGQRLDATVAGHLPFGEAALRRSVGRCLGEAAVPDAFADGHQIWMEAVRAGEGGWFTVTVGEVMTDLLPHAFQSVPTATEAN